MGVTGGDKDGVAEPVDVELSSFASDGAAVGRVAGGADDGLVCFVAFGLPGERVRARIVERSGGTRPPCPSGSPFRSRTQPTGLRADGSRNKRAFARALLVEVLRASPERVAPRCRHFTVCGGCDFQHASYREQIAAKVQLVSAAFRRLGLPDLRVVEAPAAYGYRTRVRLLVDGGLIGYRARRSRKLVPISECPILAPELEAQLATPRALLAKLSSPSSDAPSLFGPSEILLSATGAEFREQSAKKPVASWRERNGEPDGTEGEPSTTFEQANPAMNERLIADVITAAASSDGRILELYAGSGNFTLPLALAGHHGVAIERDPTAAGRLAARLGADAPYFASNRRESQWLERASEMGEPLLVRGRAQPFRVHASDVAVVLPTLIGPFATVLLDPPRAGARPAIPDILRLAPDRILYVSCDPPTLARDADALKQRYRIATATLYDFMPQTAHCELFIALTRR